MKPNRDTLYKLYYEEQRSINYIRKLYHVGWGKVQSWLSEYSIPKRDRVAKPPKRELEEKYKTYGVTLSMLSTYYNTSIPTVRKWLESYDISIKSQKQASDEYNKTHQKEVPTKESLYDLYVNKQLGTEDLRYYYNTSAYTVKSWLKHYNISIRSYSESTKISHDRLFNRNAPNKEEFVDIYNNTRSIPLLMSHFDLSRKRVYQLLNEYGLQYIPPTRSENEIHLLEYVKQLRPDVQWIENDRSVISPKELDIYSPDLEFAIEYCGHLWHSDNFGGKDTYYHQNKYKECQSKGIELITIFEGYDIEKVKSFLNQKLVKQNQVYGRHTYVKKIDSKTAKDFHESYHLNGYVGAKVHIGVFHKDSLLQVVSFAKSRYNKDYEWECTRNTIKTAVIGGTSKAFSYFIKAYEPNSIITYADLRFGSGHVYEHAGFQFSHITKPNYWYFQRNKNDKQLYSRVKFQKHKLKMLYENGTLQTFDPNLSEWENMIANEYDRIHDCGNAVWVWKNT